MLHSISKFLHAQVLLVHSTNQKSESSKMPLLRSTLLMNLSFTIIFFEDDRYIPICSVSYTIYNPN
jgi:hypothetical protein